jgi:hypothetical protein
MKSLLELFEIKGTVGPSIRIKTGRVTRLHVVNMLEGMAERLFADGRDRGCRGACEAGNLVYGDRPDLPRGTLRRTLELLLWLYRADPANEYADGGYWLGPEGDPHLRSLLLLLASQAVRDASLPARQDGWKD